MSRIYKVLLICITLMIVASTIMLGYTYYVFSSEVPPDYAELNLPGLDAPVEVVFDDYGVPHIFGKSDRDLVRALGYLHARDRLWQMDLIRRAAEGRLSEIFGEGAYQLDLFQRTIGLWRTAKIIVADMDPETMALIQAYCDGVNAFIESAPRYPTVEFRVIGYTMEPWMPEDVVALARKTAWDLSGNWDIEALRMAVENERGHDAMEAILPTRHVDPGPYIIPADQRDYGSSAAGATPEIEIDEAPSPDPGMPGDNVVPDDHGMAPHGNGGILALLEIDRLSRELYGISLTGLASNSWVLSPKKTASGGAILANDPHLAHLLPAIWHEAHLKGDDLDVIGVAFPGTPFIVLGHTKKVAWGATTTMADTQDLYKIVTDEKHPGQYYFDGEWKDFDTVEEKITVMVDGKKTERNITVRLTVHGPVMTDYVDMGIETPTLALAWAGYESSNEVMAIVNMAKADDWTSFLDALSDFKAPVQNWVYADADGHIGYIANGLVPIRKKGDGTIPVPGDDPDYLWTGYIPQLDLPQVYDPPAGFIATANNKVVPPEYPYVIGTDFARGGYRAARIAEVLGPGANFTADDMTGLQMDNKLMGGERLTPYFISAYDKAGPKDNPKLAELVDYLRKWDFQTDVDSVASTFFHETYRQAFRLTYEDEVGPDIFMILRENNVAYNAFDNGIVDDYDLFDDRRTGETVEKRDDIIVAAMVKAIEVLEKEMAGSVDKWTWGRRHYILFDHPFGSKHELLRKFLSFGPYPLQGSYSTVNNASFHYWNRPYRVNSGPSMRHVVDYGKPFDDRLTITIGQSGHRLSRFYGNQVKDWLDGGYHPTYMDRDKIEAVETGAIEFNP